MLFLYRNCNQAVQDTAEQLTEAAMSLNPVELVTPINLAQEKKLWIDQVENHGVFTNPRFEYDHQKLVSAVETGNRVAFAARTLQHICSPRTNTDEVIMRILRHRIDDALLTANIAASILLGNDAATTKYVQEKYGVPDQMLVLACQRAARIPELAEPKIESSFTKEKQAELKAEVHNAASISTAFQNAIYRYQIDNWDVVVTDQASSIDVRNKTSNGCPQVVIPTTREVNGLKLAELIGHEIECHLRDSANAEAAFTELLSRTPLAALVPLLAKSDDEMLYEGHAKLSDVAVNGSQAIPAPYYTIAIDLALSGKSFAEIGEYIYGLRLEAGESPKVVAKNTWTTVYRVMRGATHTTGGYAFTKDYAYFAGYRIAREIAESAPYILDFATLTLDEITALSSINVDLRNPKYPALNLATAR